MIDNHLQGSAVALTVSDPWEFGTECGNGPFQGQIVECTSEFMLIQLASPITFQEKDYNAVLVTARHESNIHFAAVLKDFAANMTLFHTSDTNKGDDYANGLAVIGSLSIKWG